MSKQEFRDKTERAIKSCARYLDEHAEDLAEQFAGDLGGAVAWFIEFSAGGDGAFPWVEVRTRSHKVDLIEPYGQ